MSEATTEEAKLPAAATTTGTDVATIDYGDDAGGGFENVTSADFKVSFLRVLDAKSKQVETVEGAKAGRIINTVSNALFDSVLFIPAVTEHLYTEWLPREKGGGGGQGFIGTHPLNDPMVQAALAKLGDKFQRGADGKLILPKTPGGNELVETYYFHGIQVLESGGYIPASIAMASTNIPVAQSWISTAMQEFIPGTTKTKPLFAHCYKLGSMKKTKGPNSWFVWTFSFAAGGASKSVLATSSDYYIAAKNVKTMVLEGKAKVDYAQAGTGAGEESKAEEEVPF